MRPAVSILMPIRNAREYLPACLDSIAAQSCTVYELLVIDDGSTDDSAQWLADRARCDARIRLWCLPRSGIVAALNIGLCLARTQFIARMDADDLMDERRLELQLACLRSDPELTLVASRVSGFPPGQVAGGMREYLRWQNTCLSSTDIADQRYQESPLCHPSVTFRRGPVMAAGGYRDGAFPEDYELWLRLLARGARMRKLDRVLLHWRQSPRSLSKTDPRYRRGAFDRLRAEYLAKDPRLATSRPLVIWGAGRRTRRRCNWLFAQGCEIIAWIDIDPKKIGRWLNGVRVQDPAWLARPAANERPLVLVYVSRHGAREQIAAALAAMDYRRGEDYLMVG